jgi:hypothetical protein
LWQPWVDAAAGLCERWADFEDDPFSYNETASVSLLASAAAKVGYLGLAEYVTSKRSSSDLRRKVNGRSDYWMSAEHRSWLFEFKQTFPRGVPKIRHREKLRAAVACAVATSTTEDRKVGGLIINMYWVGEAREASAIEVLSDVPAEVEYAWHLQVRGRGLDTDTFLYFSSPDYHRSRS